MLESPRAGALRWLTLTFAAPTANFPVARSYKPSPWTNPLSWAAIVRTVSNSLPRATGSPPHSHSVSQAAARAVAARAVWTSAVWLIPYALFWVWILVVSSRMLRNRPEAARRST
jgi:hypothetical protein